MKKNGEATQQTKNQKEVCIVRRNTIQVWGISDKFASEQVLARPEYFGQFGAIK